MPVIHKHLVLQKSSIAGKKQNNRHHPRNRHFLTPENTTHIFLQKKTKHYAIRKLHHRQRTTEEAADVNSDLL